MLFSSDLTSIAHVIALLGPQNPLSWKAFQNQNSNEPDLPSPNAYKRDSKKQATGNSNRVDTHVRCCDGVRKNKIKEP